MERLVGDIQKNTKLYVDSILNAQTMELRH